MSTLVKTDNRVYLLCRTLEYISDQTLFITYCFVIRGFEALGASAYSTASYVFVVNSFPQHIGSVLVNYCNTSNYNLITEFLGYFRNICRTWDEYRAGFRRTPVFGMIIFVLCDLFFSVIVLFSDS